MQSFMYCYVSFFNVHSAINKRFVKFRQGMATIYFPNEKHIMHASTSKKALLHIT